MLAPRANWEIFVNHQTPPPVLDDMPWPIGLNAELNADSLMPRAPPPQPYPWARACEGAASLSSDRCIPASQFKVATAGQNAERRTGMAMASCGRWSGKILAKPDKPPFPW